MSQQVGWSLRRERMLARLSRLPTLNSVIVFVRELAGFVAQFVAFCCFFIEFFIEDLP